MSGSGRSGDFPAIRSSGSNGSTPAMEMCSACTQSSQSMLRREIQRIRSSDVYSPQEKVSQIQVLMERGAARSPSHGTSGCSCVGTTASITASSSRLRDHSQGLPSPTNLSMHSLSLTRTRTTHQPNKAMGCKHYIKNCSRFYFECCDTIDPCHRCHMERGCEVAPPKVTAVRCNKCDHEQVPSRICTNTECNEIFSTNHCSECMVWTQSDIHHCKGCGLCRVGKAESLFHCDKCEACFHISTKEGHLCTVLSMKHQRCPMCLDATHSSQVN